MWLTKHDSHNNRVDRDRLERILAHAKPYVVIFVSHSNQHRSPHVQRTCSYPFVISSFEDNLAMYGGQCVDVLACGQLLQF